MKLASIEDEVCYALLQFGISQKLKGFTYLKEAVLIALADQEITFELTKGLYPKIADKFFTTSECVERSIRHAIDKAWRESDIYGLELTMIFTRKPTNGIFIRSIATNFVKEGILSWSVRNSGWMNRFQRF